MKEVRHLVSSMALSLTRPRRFGFSCFIRIRPLLLFAAVLQFLLAAFFALLRFFPFAVVFAQWRLFLCGSFNSG